VDDPDVLLKITATIILRNNATGRIPHDNVVPDDGSAAADDDTPIGERTLNIVPLNDARPITPVGAIYHNSRASRSVNRIIPDQSI
jgi:hypothetical protein